nr:hypothetical protein [Tanacetum cinerariifolium]
MLKSFPLLVKKFPLLEDFLTASEERFPLLRQRDATAEEVCTADDFGGVTTGFEVRGSDIGSRSEVGFRNNDWVQDCQYDVRSQPEDDTCPKHLRANDWYEDWASSQ